LGILSGIYNIAISFRRLLYTSSIRKTKKLPFKVISIGNITLGGTGKTPAVIAVSLEAKKRGFKPCVLTRGYRGSIKSPCLLGSNNNNSETTQKAGDETVLMTNNLENIPVVKGVNRFLAGMYAIGELGPRSIDLFILDDGFQHWQLYRDVDILLIDSLNPFGNGKLFPEGILREPVASIKRADIIIITKTDMATRDAVPSITKKIRGYNNDAPVFTAQHRPVSLLSISGEIKGINTLENMDAYVFAGIANPVYFQSMLRSLGVNIKDFRKFRDHHKYSMRDIKKIEKEAGDNFIITTEKDLVKLRELNVKLNVYALKIEFSTNPEFYDVLFKLLNR
jgi:tetraacyldisaccharide 4'-kinase